MTSGYYVIVHVKIGGLPVTGGMKSDYFFKLTRSVLFIGHFTAQPTQSERAVRSLSSGYEVSHNAISDLGKGHMLSTLSYPLSLFCVVVCLFGSFFVLF